MAGIRTFEEFPPCVLPSCDAGDDDQLCDLGTQIPGFCCDGACMSGDLANCGGCGIVCGSDSACVNSLGCRPAAECTSGRYGEDCRLPSGGDGLCCNDGCVDSSSDPGNCGGCGAKVPDGGICANGFYEGPCNDADCPAGTRCLFDTCALTECSAGDDDDACIVDGSQGACCGGTCNPVDQLCGSGCNVCPPGQICNADGCGPPADCSAGGGLWGSPCLTDAGGRGLCCGPLCIDWLHDSRNCLGCGLVCPAGETCNVGCDGCRPGHPCPSGTACVADQCLSKTCDGTSERCAAPDGEGVCCGDQCVNPSAAGAGCSLCGSTCPAGSTCDAATRDEFGCSAPNLVCGPAGTAALPGVKCPPGTICSSEQECDPILDCSPSSRTPFRSSCVFGPNDFGNCCGTTCTLFGGDPRNCGSCGIACPSGVCDPTTLSCLEDAPTADCPLSCGPSTVCLNGVCISSFCEGVSPRCLAENGTIGLCCGAACAHPLDDPLNCGRCGNVCRPGESCVGGTCSGSPGCGEAQLFDFCDLDAGTSYTCCPSAGCTDLLTDPANCGTCGVACGPGLRCLGGVCSQR